MAEENKKSVIIVGDTYEDALKSGLKQLGLLETEVSVEEVEEKKKFWVKKKGVKLKIVANENIINTHESNESLESLSEKVNEVSINNKSKPKFEILYTEDGVYVRVFDDVAVEPSKIINEIRERLDRKMVFDVEEKQIEFAAHSKGESIKVATAQNEIIINSRAVVDISKDKMEANLMITPNEGGSFFTLSELMNELELQELLYGIDKEQIKSMISSKLTDIYILIAKGKPPVNGIDAKVSYHFCTEQEITPTVKSDGTVDHKKLNIIKNVVKDELLFEITPATDGVEGTNILGASISTKRGKDAKIKIGKNITESEDKLKYYSAVDGRVFVDRSGKISVSEIFEVDHNVDNSTGNINFKGTVIVNKNVRTGFSISADGDIHVKGVVEGALLTAKGNITVDRGIQGNDQAVIKCEGNFTTKFIENSEVLCGGDVEADFTLHSNVTAKGKILVSGKKATIAGGRLRATKSIRAAIIGSSMGTVTELEVGIDPEMRAKHQHLIDEINEIRKKTKELMKTIDLLNKALKEGRLPASKKDVLVKSLNAYKILSAQLKGLVSRKNVMDNMINNLSKGKLHVSNVIYPGVKITIIDAIKHISDEMPRSTLYKKNGEVTIGMYEK
ncbi:MAG: DUF342 domain-containing protein [Alkaliphilus sp.]